MPKISLTDHYHQPDLNSRIINALQGAGIDTENLQCSDLEDLDAFHIGGNQATEELAALCNLQDNHQVLDLGCGIGGAARFLARKFSCQVVGLDLVGSYVVAAEELTRLTGLSGHVGFKQGDMCEMPFADEKFDRVWSQHTLMNIADKAALMSQIIRVLRPGGTAVFYEVCSSSDEPVHLPVAWASTPGQSHLCTAGELQNIFADSGMVEEVWQDVTEQSLKWLDEVVTKMKNQPEDHRPKPGLGLLMGENAGLKSRNLGCNLREGRIVVIRAVLSLPE